MAFRSSQHRVALLARIRRRYATTTQTLAFGPSLRLPFTRVADPDTVLDEVAAEEDRREQSTGVRHAEPLHLPYWAEVWDSAGGMGIFLAERPWMVAQKRVLDLGCGQGMSGCVAAALGAQQVLFADLESPALLFARFNSWHFDDRIRTRRLNWQRDTLGERFDVILGADILYERAQWHFLEPFWRAHLEPGGLLLLGEPGRASGDDFIPWIQQRGWTLQSHPQSVPTRIWPVRVFELHAALVPPPGTPGEGLS